MSYFETITDIAAFEARRAEEAKSKDISNWRNIPPGDKWSTAELHAARLLVCKDTESSHMLPGLQNGFEKAKDARNSQEQIRDLVKGPRKFDQTMICTQFVHTYGDYLGPVWAALSYFGDDNTGDDGNGYATPSLAGYEVPPEFATFKAASSFVERVAFACPPQQELRHFRPPCVVEFRDGPRPLAAATGAGARIRTTVDSAMISLGLDEDGWYERDSTQCAALVAARKRFGDVKGSDGLPVLTDSLLGQLTCEALALRLGLAQADGREGLDEKYGATNHNPSRLCTLPWLIRVTWQCLLHRGRAAIHALSPVQDLRCVRGRAGSRGG
jgi:hypothetical protein